MYAVIFLLGFIIYQSNGFSCPSDNGSYVNPDDYRSFYACSNRCATLQYCSSPATYFTRQNQACVPEPPDWNARFDISGGFKSADGIDVFIQQKGYKVYMSHETISTRSALIARYINETHAVGIQTVHRLMNNCIAAFNVRVVATGTSAHCYYETLHPYSSKCDLPQNYSGNYCEIY